MDFSRQEYWTGLPFPSPGDLPDSGIESKYPYVSCAAGGFCDIGPEKQVNWPSVQST